MARKSKDVTSPQPKLHFNSSLQELSYTGYTFIYLYCTTTDILHLQIPSPTSIISHIPRHIVLQTNMVLENSSSKEANESFDSIPASDNDPYASSEHGQGQSNDNLAYVIDGNKLPQPLPIFGPLFGYDRALVSKAIAGRIQLAVQMTQRLLRSEEVDALAYYTAKAVAINSFAPVLGVPAGIYRAVQTAPTFRFPFYQPNLETFNSSVFPHPRMPYIKGNQAVIAWHVFRGLCYGYVGKLASEMLLGGYASAVAGAGEMGDPRLKDIVKATRETIQRRQKNLPTPAGIPRPSTKPGYGQQQTQKTQEYDDASPAGGMEWSGEDNAPVSSQTIPQTSSPTTQRRQPPAQVPAQEEETPFELFDDASPTGGQGVYTDTTTTQPPNPTSGSAWERIRRAHKPVPNTNPASSSSQQSGRVRARNNAPSASGDGIASEDSFTFSKTEEERNLAQIEAQKEFDERVEKERRGGDFNGGGDQKRW